MSLVDKKYIESLFCEIDETSVIEHFLCEKEKEIFANFKYKKRKIEWLAGRIAAKYAVMQITFPKSTKTDQHPDFFKKISREKWQNLQVEIKENGRPFVLSADCYPEISISHSKELAVAMAVFDNKCGIDIQQVDPKVLKVKSKFVNEQEFDILKEKTAKNFSEIEMLALLWSAKEALRKAYEIKPLLGFLEVNLTRVVGDKQSGFDFEFTTQRKEKGKDVFQRASTRQQIYEDYVLSFTVSSCPAFGE